MTPEEQRVLRVIVANYRSWAADRRSGYAARNSALKALSRVLHDLGWSKAAQDELEGRK